MILFINACVRKDSRTKQLADCLLKQWNEPTEEVRLADISFPVTDEAYLLERDRLVQAKDFAHPMFDLANRFAAADRIVIAAPYWDLSFPAILKLYLENIYVTGLVSEYTEEGLPHGLCRARKLWYVTTAGGPYVPDFSYAYIRTLAQDYFGIPETERIVAEMLDVQGYDAERIVANTIREIEQRK